MQKPALVQGRLSSIPKKWFRFILLGLKPTNP